MYKLPTDVANEYRVIFLGDLRGFLMKKIPALVLDSCVDFLRPFLFLSSLGLPSLLLELPELEAMQHMGKSKP